MMFRVASLRLGLFPSFEDAWVIGIAPHVRRAHDRLREHGYLARARVWRLLQDRRKLESPVERIKHPQPLRPSIDTFEAPIDRTHADGLMADLARVSVPALPQNRSIGVDGTTYELTAGDAFCRCDFRWWSAHHDAWEPLVAYWTAAWARLLDAAHVPTDHRPAC